MANFFNQPGCGSCGGRGGCGSFGLQYGFSAMNVPTYGPPDRREHPAESALQSFAWNQSLHPPGIGMQYSAYSAPVPQPWQPWQQPPVVPAAQYVPSLRANVIDFYRRHAPEHLEQNFVDGLVGTFQGREVELDHLLRERYGTGLFQQPRAVNTSYHGHGYPCAGSSAHIGLTAASVRQTGGIPSASGQRGDSHRNKMAKSDLHDFKVTQKANLPSASSAERQSGSAEGWQDDGVGSGLHVSEEVAKAIMGISAMKRRNDLMQCIIW